MGQSYIEIQGTVNPDGSLDLDSKLDIRPGRVRVLVEPLHQGTVAAPPSDDEQFWSTMRAIWAGQKARGHVPQSEDELNSLRNEAEERFLETERAQLEAEAYRKSQRSGEVVQ